MGCLLIPEKHLWHFWVNSTLCWGAYIQWGWEIKVRFYDFDTFYKKCHKLGQDAYFFMQLFLACQGDPGVSSSTWKIQNVPVLWGLCHFISGFYGKRCGFQYKKLCNAKVYRRAVMALRTLLQQIDQIFIWIWFKNRPKIYFLVTELFVLKNTFFCTKNHL